MIMKSEDNPEDPITTTGDPFRGGAVIEGKIYGKPGLKVLSLSTGAARRSAPEKALTSPMRGESSKWIGGREITEIVVLSAGSKSGGENAI